MKKPWFTVPCCSHPCSEPNDSGSGIYNAGKKNWWISNGSWILYNSLVMGHSMKPLILVAVETVFRPCATHLGKQVGTAVLFWDIEKIFKNRVGKLNPWNKVNYTVILFFLLTLDYTTLYNYIYIYRCLFIICCMNELCCIIRWTPIAQLHQILWFKTPISLCIHRDISL